MLKIKSIENIESEVWQVVNQAGFLLLAGLAIASSLDLHDHASRMALSLQPTYASVGDHFSDPSRRERDEVSPHYIGYSINQRTPGRTGRQ